MQGQGLSAPVRTVFYIEIEYQCAYWLMRLFCPWLGTDWRSYYPNQDDTGAVIDVSDYNLFRMFEEAQSPCFERSKEEGRQFRLTGRWRVVRRAFYSNIPPVDCDLLIGRWDFTARMVGATPPM